MPGCKKRYMEATCPVRVHNRLVAPVAKECKESGWTLKSWGLHDFFNPEDLVKAGFSKPSHMPCRTKKNMRLTSCLTHWRRKMGKVPVAIDEFSKKTLTGLVSTGDCQDEIIALTSSITRR